MSSSSRDARRRSRKPSMETTVERIVIMPATVGRWRKKISSHSRSFGVLSKHRYQPTQLVQPPAKECAGRFGRILRAVGEPGGYPRHFIYLGAKLQFAHA